MVGVVTYREPFTVGCRVIAGLSTRFLTKHIEALTFIAFAPGLTEDLEAGVLRDHALTVLTLEALFPAIFGSKPGSLNTFSSAGVAFGICSAYGHIPIAVGVTALTGHICTQVCRHTVSVYADLAVFTRYICTWVFADRGCFRIAEAVV